MKSIENKIVDLLIEMLRERGYTDSKIRQLAIIPHTHVTANMKDVFRALLRSAQNTREAPNVIGKKISGEKGNIDPLGKALFAFDPYKTWSFCKNMTDKQIFKHIESKLDVDLKDKSQLWMRFCRTIRSGSQFLSNFSDKEALKRYIRNFSKDDKKRFFLPLLISWEVDGFGYALSADFLRGLGFKQFAKPDTHVKDVLLQTGLLQSSLKKNTLEADYKSMQLIESIANKNKLNAYTVDKYIWILCSGDKQGVNFKPAKDELIVRLKSMLNA